MQAIHRIVGPSACLWLALLLPACPNEVSQIRAVAEDDGKRVVFEIDDAASGLREGKNMTLLDLQVMRRNCTQDCTMWFLVRTPEPKAGRLGDHRIAYGNAPGGMTARTSARPLEPGSYAVGATLQRYGSSGQLEDSITLDGVFAIDLDASGQRRVRNEGR
jgi:hypothetical protein